MADLTSEMRAQTTKLIADAYQTELAEMADNLKVLDSKAQTTATIAGAVLGIAIASNRDQGTYGFVEKLTLTLIILAMATTIALCVWAMIVRRSPRAGAKDFEQLVDDMWNARENGEMLSARFELLYKDYFSLQSDTLIARNKLRSRKAVIVKIAQSVLNMAIVSLGLAYAAKIWLA